MKWKSLFNDTMNYAMRLHGTAEFHDAIHNKSYITIVSKNWKNKTLHTYVEHSFTRWPIWLEVWKQSTTAELVLRHLCDAKMDKGKEVEVLKASLLGFLYVPKTYFGKFWWRPVFMVRRRGRNWHKVISTANKFLNNNANLCSVNIFQNPQ